MDYIHLASKKTSRYQFKSYTLKNKTFDKSKPFLEIGLGGGRGCIKIDQVLPRTNLVILLRGLRPQERERESNNVYAKLNMIEST